MTEDKLPPNRIEISFVYTGENGTKITHKETIDARLIIHNHELLLPRIAEKAAIKFNNALIYVDTTRKKKVVNENGLKKIKDTLFQHYSNYERLTATELSELIISIAERVQETSKYSDKFFDFELDSWQTISGRPEYIRLNIQDFN